MMCLPVGDNVIPARFHVALMDIVVGEKRPWRETGDAMYWHGSCHVSLLICNVPTYHISRIQSPARIGKGQPEKS